MIKLCKQIDNARASHGAWKARLAYAIKSGVSEFTPELAGADDCCDFGRWLSVLPQETQGTEYFETVRTLHAQFHKQASVVLGLALTGHRQLAERAMAPGSGFDMLSADLGAALNRWKRQLAVAAPSIRHTR